VERLVRERAARDIKPKVRGKRGQDLVAMAVEGTIRTSKTFEADLRAEAGRIRMQLRNPRAYHHAGELEQARERLALIEAALKDKRVLGQRERIVAEGERIGRTLNEREQGLLRSGVLSNATRAKRARLIPAAITHLEARHFTSDELKALGEDAAHGALRHPDGRFLGTAEIESALRAAGRDPESVAYLPHQLSSDATRRMARAMHVRMDTRRPVMDPPDTRTGNQYRRGSTEASADLIRTQGVRQVTQLAKAQAIDEIVRQHGLAHPAMSKAGRLSPFEEKVRRQGGLWTAKEAREASQRLEYDDSGRPVLVLRDGERFVPMRAFANRLSAETKKVITGELQGPAGMGSLGQRLLNDRFLTHDEIEKAGSRSARNVVLVPAELVERLDAHLKPAGEINRLFQMINRPFRFAVLAQPRWLAGNFVEPYFVRLPTVGSGAVNVLGLGMDISAARKILAAAKRSEDPRVRKAATDIEAQQFGGLFIGGRGASNRRVFEDTKTYGRMVARLPATRHMAELASKIGHVLMAPGARTSGRTVS
jgi:hypothetical protein